MRGQCSAIRLSPCFRCPSHKLSFCLCQLQSFGIRAQKGKDPTGLVLCDVMGLGDGEMTGLTLHDILSVIKGHVPEGHKVSRINIAVFSSVSSIALKMALSVCR